MNYRSIVGHNHYIFIPFIVLMIFYHISPLLYPNNRVLKIDNSMVILGIIVTLILIMTAVLERNNRDKKYSTAVYAVYCACSYWTNVICLVLVPANSYLVKISFNVTLLLFVNFFEYVSMDDQDFNGFRDGLVGEWFHSWRDLRGLVHIFLFSGFVTK